eukprot:CAMPEP_0170186810 /NCGR_PEP_ID=MMETSP0040_2-20121228/40232_1 /TAXON_ID=641309 /ORGANISM="Lotharella oceanica, Strain CCMP622" /LENGTH=155 /DNA_ID=CAMNT_0010433683 /DNA_START=502 /DNA_END=969 /DNA_ORIENTATION=-
MIETLNQIFCFLQARGDADEISGDPQPLGPLELIVVGQQGVRAGDGEVGAQAGAFANLEVLVDIHRLGSVVEYEREQSSVPSLNNICIGDTIRIPHGFYGWVLPEELDQGLSRFVHLLHARYESARVDLEGNGVLVVHHVLVLCLGEGLEGFVES